MLAEPTVGRQAAGAQPLRLFILWALMHELPEKSLWDRAFLDTGITDEERAGCGHGCHRASPRPPWREASSSQLGFSPNDVGE